MTADPVAAYDAAVAVEEAAWDALRTRAGDAQKSAPQQLAEWIEAVRQSDLARAKAQGIKPAGA